MSVIFTIGKKATEIINGASSPLSKVRRANCRESKSSTSSCYQPSENVIVWNTDLDGNQVSLAYCTDTHILWCNDQQIQLQGKSEEAHCHFPTIQQRKSLLVDYILMAVKSSILSANKVGIYFRNIILKT
ncbi:unnamed protein product [Trichobilharzia szidati]|nr:unnamed protein product [Trichobilharzia szidati]